MATMDINKFLRNKEPNWDPFGLNQFLRNPTSDNEELTNNEKTEEPQTEQKPVRKNSTTTTWIKEPKRDIFVVHVAWNEGDGYGEHQRIMGAFDSKEKASKYIFDVTGMNVNDGWYVRFYEVNRTRRSGGSRFTENEYAEMWIDAWTLNHPDEGTPDWHDVTDLDWDGVIG